MKITYLTHASLLIEINNKIIITDPWLVGPSWGGSLWHFPTHNFTPQNLPKPDIIYFSHGHDDHFHEETISNFPKSWLNSKIIAPNFNVSWWEKELKKKFKSTIFLGHNEIYNFNKKLKIKMFLNDKKDFDSSIIIESSKKCIFLQTDNLMSEKEAKRIAKENKIDVAFVIPFLTGVFPGFYKWETQTLIKLAKEKIKKSLNYCSKIVKYLKPKYTIPYACDLGYLGDQFHINLIHRHNKSDLVNVLKLKKIKTIATILNPGDWIKFKNNKININNSNAKQFDKEESLIQFANETIDKYKNYKLKELGTRKPNFEVITNSFLKNLKRNIKKINKFEFKTVITIKEDFKVKNLILDFDKKNVNFQKKIPRKIDLKIQIDSNKIRNLLLKKYPMNFLTFHNGGYNCERKVMNLTKNEEKYWSWINNLDFFI